MKNAEGWDGKMRIDPKDLNGAKEPKELREPKEAKAVITNPEALEDSDYSDPDAPPVDEIEADEGTKPARYWSRQSSG
jgi:hypothetical protein